VASVCLSSHVDEMLHTATGDRAGRTTQRTAVTLPGRGALGGTWRRPARWPTWGRSPGQERQHLIGRWGRSSQERGEAGGDPNSWQLVAARRGRIIGAEHLQRANSCKAIDSLAGSTSSHVPWREGVRRMAKEALVGFQGRGCAGCRPTHLLSPFLLDALLLQWPSIRGALLGPWWNIRPRIP